VADESLLAEGSARIEWADEQMPVLGRIRSRFEGDRPLDGLLVAACLHVTALWWRAGPASRSPRPTR
jgi:adenosylhomocysteinase